MKFLILGDGPEERAWADALDREGPREVALVFPRFGAFPSANDFEDALAAPEIDAVVVGGPAEFRSEALRRAAAEGFTILALHPPGENSDPYYQVALCKEETGARVVPDLPARLHPGVAAIVETAKSGAIGELQGFQLEATVSGDLRVGSFSRWVDLIRSLIGEVATILATGEPAGEEPTIRLTTHMVGEGGLVGEIRLRVGTREPVKLETLGSRGSLRLEFDPGFVGISRFRRIDESGDVQEREIPAWDSRAAILEALEASARGLPAKPDLLDATRAMELTEAAARSLKKGRKIELHYEEISESGTFKSLMTSLGCMIFLGVLFTLPIALAGPPLGFPWTIYLAYFGPPIMALYVFVQFLGLGIKRPRAVERPSEDAGSD